MKNNQTVFPNVRRWGVGLGAAICWVLTFGFISGQHLKLQ